MYCSECGHTATGKYCANCGARTAPTAGRAAAGSGQAPEAWEQQLDYERLLEIPEVRDRIARAASQAKKSMSGEELLDLYGKALRGLAGVPLPMATVAKFAQSLHGKLGLKTGKARSQFFAAPPGTVLVSLLCALARHGRTLKGVHQLRDGCILVAALPSDMFALEGDLVITATRRPAGVLVEATTEIRGQLFDWGKSTRCLDELFRELGTATSAA